MLYTTGSVPTSSVHWFTAEETRALIPPPGLPLPGEQDADDELGGFRGQRRQPLHEQEFLDAELASARDQAFGERLGGDQDHDRRVEEEEHHHAAALPFRQGGDRGRRAAEVGLMVLRSARDDHVGDEEPDEKH